MTKKIELIVVLFLLTFAFFAGVSYSDAIKHHAGWLFEPKEEEVELPDLSKEGSSDATIIDDTGEAISNPASQNAAPAPVQNNEIQNTSPSP